MQPHQCKRKRRYDKKPQCYGEFVAAKPSCTVCATALRCHVHATLKAKIRKRYPTLDSYTKQILFFCNAQTPTIAPFDFPTLSATQYCETLTPDKLAEFNALSATQKSLTIVEWLTEKHILARIDVDAPKALNMRYCAIKSWCFALGMIQNRKLFREIVFDKSSRKSEALMEMPIEETHVKAMFELTNEHERALVGLYGVNGFRPALIPQARISWIFAQHYKIENGVFRFTVKNPFMYIPKNVKGNKATGITFFTILHSRIATAIEHSINNLNAPNTITPQTPLLGRYRSIVTISDKIHELYAQVGFAGRPYLLRSFADFVYDEAGLKRDSGGNDEDMKEQLMMHKGVISAVYQNKGLPESVIQTYTRMFQSVENWVNEHIFGAVSTTQLSAAEQTALFAESLGANKLQIDIALDGLRSNRIAYDAFSAKLRELTDAAFAQKMTENLEKALVQFAEKRGLRFEQQTQPQRSA